ncbi:MAG: hypothetical protein K6E49_08505 [Lachnospiraceae bacterium]|nr:hypothetical protein [Lachnospiraceae bacterium]
MGNYLVKDIKRALGSKMTKVYLICTAALILVANIAVICFRFIYGSNEGTFSYNVFEYASWCFLIPYYSCIVIGMIAVGDDASSGEYKSMKPWQRYIEKLAVAVVLAALLFVVAFVVLYIITTLFHINEGLIPGFVIKSFFSKAFLSLPLWFAGISFAIMVLFIFDKRWKAVVGFAVVTVVIPQIIRIFSLDTFKFELFRTIRRYTITQSFGLVPYPSYPDRSPALIVTLGFVYGIIAIIIGITVYTGRQKNNEL